MNENFARIERLPTYVFAITNELKAKARSKGEDIIDFGMGNPDQPPPQHIVDKLVEVAQRTDTHRYSASRGIPRLRRAITNWYKERYDVSLDPDTEAIVTLGSKEGLANLAQAIVSKGDTILVPSPAYPIHPYGFVIAGADIRSVPCGPEHDFFSELESAIKNTWPKPKAIVLNYPSNPTSECVELEFFERVIQIAKENQIWVIQDLAYADIVFDGYKAPSIFEVAGAKEVAVEFFSMSKSYNMPGWRVGFMVGNASLVAALTKIKSYLDYGIFTPIQVAAIEALEGDQSDIGEPSIIKLVEALDSYIPMPERAVDGDFLMPVEDVFSISGRGTVVTGRIERGVINVGDEVEIVGIADTAKTTCTGVEMFRKLMDQGEAGDNVGILLRGTKREEVQRGQVLCKPGSITPHTKFEAEVYILSKEEGGRHTPFFAGYRPQFYFRTTDVTGNVELPEGMEMVMPGDNISIGVELLSPIAMEDGLRFAIREGGRTVGAGVVSKVIE